MIIAFLGPEATFSHQAALKLFSNVELLPEKSIQDVFEIVKVGKANFGVVPVENSTEGSVNVTLDLLSEFNLSILKETSISISHYLLSKTSLKELKIVFSHPQALAQCRKYLEKNLPNVELAETASTAKAAEISAGTQNSAAIASKLAAEKFGLKILAENIQDSSNNLTRFIAVGKNGFSKGAKTKTSILFAVSHNPGALFDALKAFKVYDVNLTKIESRPSRKNAWEYNFFVDFEGFVEEEKIKKALKELQEHCEQFRVLGSFEVVE